MWSQIVGHNRQIKELKRTIAKGRVPNAYLFSGPRGIGKRRVADAFTAAFFCAEASSRDFEPCGSCANCRKLASGNHPDCFVIVPEESERGAVQSIKIDVLRELQSKIIFHPLEAPAKISIIDGADKLGDNAANSLLKILEEPPEFTHFILITPFPQRLLPTIRSRCRQITFAPLSDEELADAVASKKSLSPGEAMRIARLSGGSMGTAEVLDPEFVENVFGRFQTLARRVSSADIFEIAQAWKNLDAPKTLLIFDLLASWYRDILRFQATGKVGELIHAEAANKASTCPPGHAMRCLSEIDSTRRIAETSANKQLMFEQLLFTLSRQ